MPVARGFRRSDSRRGIDLPRRVSPHLLDYSIGLGMIRVSVSKNMRESRVSR